MLESDLRNRLASLHLIAFDFDGVFTDGTVVVSQDGTESVVCSRRDGLGISELKRIGIKVVVISRERNPVVRARCSKLGIECVQAVDDKAPVFRDLLARERVAPTESAFMGDDINDIGAMGIAGISFTVADGCDECKSVASYITLRCGGNHAVREVCDLILNSRL